MADIAFLLLIFFIITSNVVNDRGTKLTLPIIQEPKEVQRERRNVCMIIMNNQSELLVNDKPMKSEDLPVFVKKFILNNGVDPSMSASPADAIIVFKTVRSVKYPENLKLINSVQSVYFDVWAEIAGVSSNEILGWDVDTDKNLSEKLDKLRELVPYNFVISEPK